MVNYIGEDKFTEWFKENYNSDKYNMNEVLNDTYMNFCNTGKAEYVIPALKSKSGVEVKYTYRVENLGCCGASTICVYF